MASKTVADVFADTTVWDTADYRLVEVDDPQLLASLTTIPTSTTAAASDTCVSSTRKREREQGDGKESEEDQLQTRTARVMMKATPTTSSFCTDDGNTFILRRVSYSNSLFLTDPLTKQNAIAKVDAELGLNAVTNADGTKGKKPTSPNGNDQYRVRELVPAIFESVHQPGRVDPVLQYLETATVTVQELEGGPRGGEGVGTIQLPPLKTWVQLVEENAASEREIRDCLASRYALIIDGYVRVPDRREVDTCIKAVLSQVEGREPSEGCVLPWELVPVQEILNNVAYPPLLVEVALALLNGGKVVKRTDVLSLNESTTVAVMGEILLRTKLEATAKKELQRADFLIEWGRLVPHGMQSAVEIALLKDCVLTSMVSDTIVHVDRARLPSDPKKRLNELFRIAPQQRILGDELRHMMQPAFLPPKKEGGRITDLDALIGRACRDHRGKKGQFFSFE